MNPSIFCVFIPPTLYLIYSKISLLKSLNLSTRKPQFPKVQKRKKEKHRELMPFLGVHPLWVHSGDI